MAHLEGALEWLRPLLLGSETWEYCVVWRLSAVGTSSPIEWVNCCCVAGTDGESCINSPVREDKKGFLVSAGLCRDSFNPHPATKKSCLALSQFPFFMPLHSDIYGEVIVSSQPRWINLPDKLAPEAFNETHGTRVLIPVIGGLVELFASEQIMENREIKDFIIAQCNGFVEMDCIPLQDYDDATLSDGHYLQQSEFKASMADLLAGKFNSHPKLECSSSWSIPSGHASGCVSESSSPKQTVMVQSNTLAIGKEISNASHGEDKKEEVVKEQQFKSKNLIIERNRRARINSGLRELRSLVPKITKMNQAATLDDSIDHILEMTTKVKDLQEELEELERDNGGNSNAIKSEPSKSNKPVQFAANHDRILEAQVEVNQLTMREFLIKILCKAKLGAFTRILETLNHLGLQVTEINAASCKGMSSNSFVVQVTNGDIQARELREALIKHSCG